MKSLSSNQLELLYFTELKDAINLITECINTITRGGGGKGKINVAHYIMRTSIGEFPFHSVL